MKVEEKKIKTIPKILITPSRSESTLIPKGDDSIFTIWNKLSSWYRSYPAPHYSLNHKEALATIILENIPYCMVVENDAILVRNSLNTFVTHDWNNLLEGVFFSKSILILGSRSSSSGLVRHSLSPVGKYFHASAGEENTIVGYIIDNEGATVLHNFFEKNELLPQRLRTKSLEEAIRRTGLRPFCLPGPFFKTTELPPKALQKGERLVRP